MVGAGLSGPVGWLYGFTAVLWLAALFGALSIAPVLMIPRAIPSSDDAARGLVREANDDKRASGAGSGRDKAISNT